MILTGDEIRNEWLNGRITIDPFVPEQVNPKSYDFRLGSTLRVRRHEEPAPQTSTEFDEIEIPEEGVVLEPGRLYLAHTAEVLGSDHYAPDFAARSSVARLGMLIKLSTSLADIGYKGQWTLQLYASNRVRVYPGMDVGQVMWWRVQGGVVLCNGKYRRATGPRTSDVHLDFDKQIARQRFPDLGAWQEPAEAGAKFAALAEASQRFRVPAAFCIPAGEFADAATADQTAALETAFAGLRTAGAFDAESIATIRSLGAQVRFPPAARCLIESRLREVHGDGTWPAFAVRPSGLDEDGETVTPAGLHRSVLNVRGLDGIIAAIEQCWASHYEPPAVAARVREGDLRSRPRLAVIVQAVVDPKVAGVTFTGLDERSPDNVLIEYVNGQASVPALRDNREQETDVEWAAGDRGVHLVQIRPLTAVTARSHSVSVPLAEVHSLSDGELPASFHNGGVAGVYGGALASRRRPVYQLAGVKGVVTGAGWVLQFNRLGLEDVHASERLRAALSTGRSGEYVLDVGDDTRQMVVSKSEVLPQLIELTGAQTDGTRVNTAVVRDFVCGDFGVISRMSGDGLVVEYTRDGLAALNRGSADRETISIAHMDRPHEVVAPPTAAPLLPHLAHLGRLTAAVQARYGAVTLEWVLSGGEPYFVDYSVHEADEIAPSAMVVEPVSPGTESDGLAVIIDKISSSRPDSPPKGMS